jgi:hypothetical protein
MARWRISNVNPSCSTPAVLPPASNLSYRWLVLPQTERERLTLLDPTLLDPTPRAINAHLTGWRTPATSIRRARFHIINWPRDSGHIPYLGGIALRSKDDFAGLFAALPSAEFDALLLGHDIVARQPGRGDWTLRRVPAEPAHREAIFSCYRAFLGSLAALNHRLATQGWLLVSGMAHCIDVSSTAAIAALGETQTFDLVFDQPLGARDVHLLAVRPAKAGRCGWNCRHSCKTHLFASLCPSLPHHRMMKYAPWWERHMVGRSGKCYEFCHTRRPMAGSTPTLPNPTTNSGAGLCPRVKPKWSTQYRFATVGSCFAQRIERFASV